MIEQDVSLYLFKITLWVGAFEILLPAMYCQLGSNKLIKIQKEKKKKKLYWVVIYIP